MKLAELVKLFKDVIRFQNNLGNLEIQSLLSFVLLCCFSSNKVLHSHRHDQLTRKQFFGK